MKFAGQTGARGVSELKPSPPSEAPHGATAKKERAHKTTAGPGGRGSPAVAVKGGATGPKLEPAKRLVRPARPTMADALGGLSRSIANPQQVAKRVEVFTVAQVSKISHKVGVIPIAPWPRLKGCLTILFSSRAGSTYLARELECAFDIGRLRETLNPNQIKNRAAAQIVESRRDAWFSFKAGGTSVIAAELYGFFDAYLCKTSFILLVRRDIVAQAVSRVKAKQTEQWHSTQEARRAAVYNGAKIAQGVKLIADGVERLRLYVERSERPWRSLVYEDFEHGDFTRAVAACDALGIPRRKADSSIRSSPVERIGDAVNQAWAARFREEMDLPTRDRIARYLAEIG